jgi:hypothetical protein
LDGSIHSITIENAAGEVVGWSPGESDTIEIKLDWLTVKFPRSRRKFRFVAEPNTSGKKMKLVFGAMVFDCQFFSDIVQDK